MSDGFEWLDWLEPSGPFVAVPVLKKAFPQGLDTLDPNKRRELRQAYDEYRQALDDEDPEAGKFQTVWIDLVLRKGLEYDEDGSGDNLKSAVDLPESLASQVAEHGVMLKPDYAVVDDQNGDKPMMLIQVYSHDVDLSDSGRGDSWASSPRERMVRLCRDTSTRLGLVTNGEEWLFVDAPVGSVLSFSTWYARLWGPEPVLLQAFVGLLGIRRFFVGEDEQLPALIDKSVEYQDEVTEALGEQVRRAVEVLIQALDKADLDRNRELLNEVDPRELYEAGLTVMMRLVFLLSAEERELLPLNEERYVRNYAVSSLRMQLRGKDDAILQRRWDAWSRLLAIFRAIYGGINHETLRMPALGGTLFNPDRFPFLEGRDKDSNWKTDPAKPLPIDNQTVLLLLDAIQLFEGRTLSYRGLDIEQLGYVYEGLLDHTVKRAKEVTVELDATKSAKQPWVTLGELESARLDGEQAIENLLKERTGSSVSRVRNDLKKEVKPQQSISCLTACHNDQGLHDQLEPYFHLIRRDSWGRPLVYPEGSFVVTTGEDRRQTGSHYTPTSLTQAMVKETLEPVVYSGPADGKPREEWELKTPEQLLDLKICDPAMGSGAFLVQVCRWLGARVVESWVQAELNGRYVDVDGRVSDKVTTAEPLPRSLEERAVVARRLIAERCIYGVDINPLAVELAKLSVWLITLAEGRPFGFLDHNLRSGDSLLGTHSIDQLRNLGMDPASGQKQLFAQSVSKAVEKAIAIRLEISKHVIRDIHDVDAIASLNVRARKAVRLGELIADALIGEVLAKGKSPDLATIAVMADEAIGNDRGQQEALGRRAVESLSIDLVPGKSARKPFHWPLEFPEVFAGENPGFDAIVGNPPFLGNRLWRDAFGEKFQWQCQMVLGKSPGKVDLCVVFHRRAESLLRSTGCYGLLSTSSIASGNSIRIGLGEIVQKGAIYSARKRFRWPGSANVDIALICFYKGNWKAKVSLDGRLFQNIGPALEPEEVDTWSPKKIRNSFFAFEGSNNSRGTAFLVSRCDSRFEALKNEHNSLLRPYISGNDITSSALTKIGRWALDIGDQDLQDIAQRWPIAYRFLLEEVKPTRTVTALKSYKGLIDRWWQFWNPRADFMRRLRQRETFVAYSKDTKYPICMVANSNWIYTNNVLLLAIERPDTLSICLSSAFRIWLSRFTGGGRVGSLKLISGTVDKFPLPATLVSESGCTAAARFNELARIHSKVNHCGLTGVMNAINDREIDDEIIEELRSCMSLIDSEVLLAYGWTDLDPTYAFQTPSELDESASSNWSLSNGVELEVHKRLVSLNKECFEKDSQENSEFSEATKSFGGQAHLVAGHGVEQEELCLDIPKSGDLL